MRKSLLKDQNQSRTLGGLDALGGKAIDLQKYVSKLSPLKREIYEERATILEFEAGSEREHAEKEAAASSLFYF